MSISINQAVIQELALQRSNVWRSVNHKPKGSKRLGMMMLALLSLVSSSHCAAQEIHWNGNAGNGQFFDGNNWSPAGPPQNWDIIRIGNLPGTAGANVMMGGATGIVHDGLYLNNGVTLDMNGSELVSHDVVSITGNNTRLIARPVAFFHPHDFQGQLQMGAGAHFELRDNVPVIFSPTSFSWGTITGRGSILTGGFVNDGVIQPGANGGLEINAGFPAAPHVDLDGATGNGSVLLTTQFSQLNVGAANLSDSFSSNISMAPGALLNMNIQDGWTADSFSEINVLGFFNNAASQISGSHMTFGGTMNVTLAEGKLRINAPLTVQSTASINVGHTDQLEFDGPTTVQGGTFNLGQFGQMQFDGPTTLGGGTFNTFANNYTDGTIAFNGATTWNGIVAINGSARQQGNATVSGVSGATINANRFDMDGLSDTVWNINSGLTVNAEMIATTSANRFEGTMNVNGGLTPRVTINLADPAASWTMGGTMNLNGLTHLVETKVAGSHMIVQGDLNVNGGRVRINSNTTFSDSGWAGPAQVSIANAGAELRMHGQTLVESGVEFMGAGTMFNAASGAIVLESGVQFNDINLVNLGLVGIGNGAGVASVDRFTNTGTWEVEIGGYLAGAEHDLLLVTGGMAELGGILDVDLIEYVGPDFIPQIGDEFTILSSLAGINGTFAADPTTFFQGRAYHWSVQYNPHDVTLQLTAISIPEPAAGLLLTLCGMVFGLRRRRASQPIESAEMDRRTCKVSNNSNLSAVADGTQRAKICVSTLTVVILLFGSVSTSHAQQVDWNAGDGVWSNAGSWSPVGVPGAGNQVTIGNGSFTTVVLDQQAIVASLSILSGSGLDTGINYLQVNGDTLVSGNDGGTQTRFIIRARDGLSFRTDDLNVEQGASVFVGGGIAAVFDRLTIDNAPAPIVGTSRVHGVGFINLFGAGTSLINDGTIEGRTGNGLIFQQINGGGFDLDGTLGGGQLRALEYDSITDQGARLRFNGTHLTDSFSGLLTIGSGAQIAMNLTDGWVVDSGGEFVVTSHFATTEAARISGSALDFSGEINMQGSNGIVASDLDVHSHQIHIREAARINTNENNVLRLGGNATSWIRVDGGEFNVGEYGKIEFHGNTEIRGGTFQTFSNQLFDGSGGSVLFNGDTLWSGTTTLGGAARQNGTATVNGLGATIHADRFDLDGLLGDTTWNIHSSLVINADAIDETTMGFNGTLNIAGGSLARLTLNLTNPADSWSMEGEMNLAGVSHLYETRVAGSTMVVAGQMNVTGGRVRINADTIYSDTGPFGPALVSIGPAEAALRMHGNTVVHDGVEFGGNGTFVNATSGQMLFHDGVALSDVGLENHGDFEIGELVGVASVDRFMNTGTWSVDIGGYLAGAEHDLLLVAGATELDGLLDVRLIDDLDLNVLPEIGDEFTILYSGGSLSGSFLDDPTSLFGGSLYHWSVLYNPHDVTLQLTGISAVPEPTCGMLPLGIGMLLTCYRRRPRPAFSWGELGKNEK